LNPKRILTPLDGSESAKHVLDAAISLAKRYGSDLFSVYVLPFPAVQAYQPDRAAKEQMFREAKGFLENYRKSAEQEGLQLKYEILEGNPGSAIVDYAQSEKRKFDLIVIGSRGLGGLKETFLGSVSNYVIHKSRIPVLVVK
jgi:nucleotide-binding universal stress UspA family protein